MRVSSDLALIRTICNLRLIIKSVSNLKVLMGLTEELFECNFMTATKGNFLGLTKLLLHELFVLPNVHLIENNHNGGGTVSPISRPLFSQPSQINVNLSDYYGEIMTSAGKLGFSLLGKIFLFRHYSSATISSKHSGSQFVLSRLRTGNSYNWVFSKMFK